jgi:hypothetical protein
MTEAGERWWWDLAAGKAVRDDERGPARDLLGPYPSREAAEHWRDQRDAREEAWQESEAGWPDEEPGGEGAPRAP